MGAAFLLLGLLLLPPMPAGAQEAEPWCFDGIHPGELEGTLLLPEGDLFCPLLADPKAEHSFASYLQGDFPPFEEGSGAGGELRMASVGLGDAFPIVRFAGQDPGDGIQVGLVGSVFAQFNLDAPSLDLINADYLVGIPVTARWGGFSTRLRLYHQSSHLGDEFLLRSDVERENLSFEAVDLLLSQEMGPVRTYAGGEYLFNREPETVEGLLAHGGVEVRVGRLRGLRLVGAVDVKSTEQQEWSPALSVRGGVEIAQWRDSEHPPRLWSLLLEYYDGASPYGQFFQEQVSYLGVGLHLSL